MSSILTNNSAMVALQTLKSINNDLGKVQSEISTGKSVASAKDNAATWAISKVMSSDVEGFKAISDSLSLGQSTVGVALNGAEGITDLLTEIKGKIVNSQEENVDRAKIQTDIEALRGQISSIAGAAQFNGLNLLSNVDATEGSGTASVLSSLDRAADGTVSPSNIDVVKQDLGTQAASVDATGGTFTAAAVANTVVNDANASADIDLSALAVAGTAVTINFVGTDGDSSAFTSADYTNATAGGTTQAEAAASVSYVVRDGDTAADIGRGLANAFATFAEENGYDTDVINVTANADGITVGKSVAYGTATDNVTVRVGSIVSDDNVIGGGLAALADIDVSDADGAAAALASIEGLIQTSIDAAAALGSDGKRIETQNEFVGKLMDGLKSGIGSLVDADMEAASAKLQALQTQQQLGVQALSIANQAPQTILSLFR